MHLKKKLYLIIVALLLINAMPTQAFTGRQFAAGIVGRVGAVVGFTATVFTGIGLLGACAQSPKISTIALFLALFGVSASATYGSVRLIEYSDR